MNFWDWLFTPEYKNCFVCDHCNKVSQGLKFCSKCLDKLPRGVYYSDTGFPCKPSIVDYGKYKYQNNENRL